MGTDVSVWRAGELQAGWRLTTWWMFCGCEFGCFMGERRTRNKMEMVDPQNHRIRQRVCHPKRSRSFGALHKTRACALYDVILGLLRFSTYVTALSE